jgi:ectoine hydroxylase-related dioxygenase (phytanoyl-CoA dioxygenase family)
VLQIAEIERKEGKVKLLRGRERVWGLIYKGEIFEWMVQHPVVIELAETILGRDMTLSGFSAHILQPKAPSMGQHIDYPYWAMKPPYPKIPVFNVQLIWMTEDFTQQNGALLFVPESQASGSLPDRERFDREAQIITGKAGSVIISHGACWHNTLPNTSEEPRVSILCNYGPKVIRPLEDLQEDYKQEVIDRASPKLLQLLGYNFKKNLGRDVLKTFSILRNFT